jgi:transcriptional regulator with XRE-family HTH domain
MKFGEYLKSQRDARGWTQPMAAEKIGIEQSYLSKLETGKASPSEEMFERLMNAYDIDVDHLGAAVALPELERLREIGAIRDLVRRDQQATARGRRRWLLVSLLLIALGGALLSFVITERRYADAELEYLSKGVVQDGESDFLYMHLQPFRPDMLAGEFADDPLLPRLDPVVRWHAEEEDLGAYYIEPAEGGRRVFEKTGDWRHVPPRLNGHLGHALALAMLLFGFGGLFVARRW